MTYRSTRLTFRLLQILILLTLYCRCIVFLLSLWLPCIADAYIIFSSCGFLWSPYVIGQTIIFLPCDFYLLSFFLFFRRVISAVGDWMSTILPHMVRP